MPKFTNAERILLKSIVATLSIKRVPESEIIDYRLNITLSNYFDVAPDITGHTISTTPETKSSTTTGNEFIV